MTDRSSAPRERLILVLIFGIALLAHFFLATRNWRAGFMPGHEFRQAQTAIITHYIDADNNFSLLYETPILGKPWVSILLEVPVYEWSVVGLSRLTGWPHFEAARTITLTCFYLTLLALFLLLGRFRLSWPRRLLFLALVLACPVYIFYSRAFLIDSMELMCSAWFLYGYLEMVDRRRWTWFLLATGAGVGAALIKSATLAVWLPVAAGYVAWKLWRDWRAGGGWGEFGQNVFWGLVGVAVPLGSLYLWVALTDPIKAAHASAWIFTSKNLSEGNWGLVDLMGRFSASTWGTLADRWRDGIMPPWLLLGLLAAGLLLLPRVRWQALGLAAVFFWAQLMFPYAYAYQDYYFYSCAVFLLGGLGFLMVGLLDSRLPRWLAGLALAVPFAAQWHTYAHNYYPQQMVPSNGGFPFTEALREFLPKRSVIVVAGADWAAMIPLYAQHRALMIRNGLEQDFTYLQRAFGDLAEDDVAALVLVGSDRTDRQLRDLAVRTFDLDPAPTFSHAVADVYCARRYDAQMRKGLRDRGCYGNGLTLGPAEPVFDWSNRTFWISPALAAEDFPNVQPAPVRGQFHFGPSLIPADGDLALNAHPDSDLWVPAPSKSRRIEWDFGLFSPAYERAGDKTDGVEFAIEGVLPGLGSRVIYRRVLDPVAHPKDRGRQREVIPFHPRPGEILHFSTRPHVGYAYDWAYWVRIDVK